ncbi:MAG TPA: GAF domain-containing protein [Blastocatellia bacterium]|nr:GAF domain-containing protein [Blastocatellia bacterium]
MKLSLIQRVLSRTDLYRQARDAARRDALTTKLTSAIHSSLDSDTVLTAIVHELGKALSVCRCRIALLPSPLPETITITHEYVADCCSTRPPNRTAPGAGHPHVHAVLASERPLAIDDTDGHPLFEAFKEDLEASGVKSVLSATIRLGAQPIGFLSLHRCDQKRSWTQWEIDVVHSVAEQAAVAIRQAELYREAGESALQAALVNQIIASIRRSLDLNETLQVAVEELGRSLGADRTYFRKLVGDEFVVVAEYLSDPSLSVRHFSTEMNDYITTHLMETHRTLVINDVPAFIGAHPDVAATVKVWKVKPVNLSQIVCPIFINGRFWGALSVGQTSRSRKWSASDVALIEMVTGQVEVAISHSYLFEETKQAAEREALISHVIQRINESNQLDQIFPIVARELGEHLGADRIMISRLDDRGAHWTNDCEYSNGEVSRPNATLRTEDFVKFASLVQNDLLLCNDVENDPRISPELLDLIRPTGTRSFLAAQIAYTGKAMLVITATMKSAPRCWTAEDVELVRAVANQVSTALQRSELFKQVSHGKFEWEATFDALSDGILIFDREGKLKRANLAGAAFEGAEIRDLIGRQCCTLMQGIEGETCRVAQVLKTGRPATFELMPERLRRPVLVTISALTSRHSLGEFMDPDPTTRPDGPLGAVCIVRDLSELRAAEAVAREQRTFLVKLIEHANDAIFAFSPDGRLIWFNEQLVTQTGFSRVELGSGDYSQLVPHEDKKLAVERFTRALEGEPQSFEMHGLKKTGETRLLLVTYTPIYDEGGVTSVLTIARDITEERLASERAAQAEKLRALGQLASGVAHNFNNILAAILGHAQLMKRDCSEEGLLQRMEIIERAALDGAQTVKRIQGFGLQQNESVSEEVDINSILQDSAALTQAKWYDEARARGLRYLVEADLKPLPVVNGSASELREVFVNIILNALDAMPQGGRLQIATEAKGNSAVISFTDSGIGMSREVCEKIFEPFFTTKGATGMGLGLAVSYGTIERHGGRIEAQSTPGSGTTFTITLPAALSPAVASEPQTELADDLVGDGSRSMPETLAVMLNSGNQPAGHASNGSGASQDDAAK